MSESQLAASLGELGWRPETLAHRLVEYAALHGRRDHLHEKTPYKWLNGHRPRPPWPELIAALLTAELSKPISPTTLGWPPVGKNDQQPLLRADNGLQLPWTAEGATRAMRAVTEADPMERRIFLTAMGAAMSAPAHQWLLADPIPHLTRTGKSRRVHSGTVDELDLMAASLRRLDDGGGGGALLQMVRAHLRQVVRLLEHGNYTDTVGRRLHSNAGELLRLAGWLSFDGGQHPRAQRYWMAALHAAHTAGDQALAANTIGFMSCQAKDIRQPHEAVTLAESARTGYRGASPRVSAILNLRAAEAYATSGSTVSCRRAIDDAFTNLDSPTTTAPDWSYWLNPGHAHGQAGYCYLQLGQYSDARRHFRQALRLQDPTAAREGALRYTLLATTYVRQNDPDLDQALALAGHAVDILTDDVTSSRCVGHLNTLLRDLTPHQRRPAVRQLAEQVQSLQSAMSTS
ncbi:tetratricopeptide repeat protein [Nocardia sp. NBC_00565]|uniref:tetratricopeptide repeat protein n=1 Tax=Nocardia sp. NBC_00565 TaxID=2975993 RepID=UPI002E819B24|nr:tetratricopeptide repeat protein [Nocardia sp. NBC_00565]WUC07507.1 tetratricopeptide repeat protein [Nocardia sp. NBC_00565]